MAHRAPLVVEPYSPRWPVLFESERAALNDVFAGTFCVVEHVGSTAVPELAAKPIIDIMLGTRALRDIEERIEAMRSIGYEYMPEHEKDLPERRFFAKPLVRPRLFHVHAVVFDGAFWKRHLVFRDALRADRSLAESYASLKHRLAAQFGDDRDGYTRAKGPFIAAVVARHA